MIHAVLIFNKKCQPRLIKFYTPVELPKQKLLLDQVYELISQRNSAIQSSFLVTPPSLLSGGGNNVNEDIQIIYKNYATLYFTLIVDDQESELAILDLIQTFVEALDRCFAEVNELDLIFNWQTLESVLEEIIQGGMVIETNVRKIVEAVDELNRTTEDDMKFGKGLGNAFQAITQGNFLNWGARQ
ncbi:HHR031Wp [Eremothecium sinecaudum]|uniref:AP complex subunit sigma n=1 Tax=Eremothecium sinecaudum TaxID=45286 RepID=A0A120K2W2_9SACH|nr:HHR031Wp [Eremothecium sinecaudum]AMD22800.1 HHR031Wp [Eremothecium sinecaudum]